MVIFGPAVKNSAIQFSIYSAVRIRPNDPVCFCSITLVGASQTLNGWETLGKGEVLSKIKYSVKIFVSSFKFKLFFKQPSTYLNLKTAIYAIVL